MHFHDQHDYLSQLNDIESSTFHFNAYYIHKYGNKSLKNFGPEFYTLGEINKRVTGILKYCISLHHSQDTYKCAKLRIMFNELLMLIEFRDTFKQRIMEILNMNENMFYSHFNGTSEHFFVLFLSKMLLFHHCKVRVVFQLSVRNMDTHLYRCRIQRIKRDSVHYTRYNSCVLN